MINDNLNIKRAKAFKRDNVKVHISLNKFIPNTNKNLFRNGFISFISPEEDYFILEDLIIGKSEIFFEEIKGEIKIFKNE